MNVLKVTLAGTLIKHLIDFYPEHQSPPKILFNYNVNHHHNHHILKRSLKTKEKKKGKLIFFLRMFKLAVSELFHSKGKLNCCMLE